MEPESLRDTYFDDHMTARQILFWSVTTRRQLDRWGACVAEALRCANDHSQPPGELVWRSEAERHLALVAAANLARALKLLPQAYAPIPELLPILTDIRNVLEHWDEHLPAFLSYSKGALKLSGRNFAERFPDSIPWSAFAWNSHQGPMLLARKISAAELHEALDQLEASVLRKWSSMAEYIPERPPSPWIGDEEPRDRWWPRPTEI